MKRRNRMLTTIFSVVALAISLMAVPAFADTNETNCTFSGTATLEDGFPAIGGSGSFDGTIECVGTLSISGALTATFTYNEDPNLCPVQGDANTDAADEQFEIDTNNDGVSDYTGEFSWLRGGATAAIEISEVNGPGATDAFGEGTAAFEAPPEALECNTTGPLEAVVEGAAVIADTD